MSVKIENVVVIKKLFDLLQAANPEMRCLVLGDCVRLGDRVCIPVIPKDIYTYPEDDIVNIFNKHTIDLSELSESSKSDVIAKHFYDRITAVIKPESIKVFAGQFLSSELTLVYGVVEL